MSASVNNPLVMLVVEDNPADVVFFREALEATQTVADIHTVDNGIDALKFLRRLAPFTAAPRPDVIVLDLNLPVKNGHEVLLEIATISELNTIPVAILTTSASDTHVCEACPRGRCLYFTKTDDFKNLQNIVRQIVKHARTTQANM